MLSLLEMQIEIPKFSWNLHLGQSKHTVISCHSLADKCLLVRTRQYQYGLDSIFLSLASLEVLTI